MDNLDYRKLAETVADVMEARDKQHERNHPRGEVMSVGKVEDIVRRVVSEQIDKAITKTVSDTLISFGLDPQQRNEIQRDMLFIRDMRTLSADSKKHIVLAILGALVAGLVTAVWFYVKASGKA